MKNDGYGIVSYSVYANNEIDHYEDRFLYGSIDGRYPTNNLLRELDKEERNIHARESMREKPWQKPLEVKTVLFYTKKLTNEDLKGYDMVLLAKIGEPVYVR
ncbi:MAG: hypothetical protein KHZ82_02510 [Peptoniphilus harei]|nr:hypothetical protein [Peptoniphilus harei]